MKRPLLVLVALLAGGALAVPLRSNGAQPRSVTTVVQCPAGSRPGSPYCQTSVRTVADGADSTTAVTVTETSGEDPVVPADGLEPVMGESVVTRPVAGTILVRVPGTRTFVALTAGQTIPLGSVVDARKGSVTVAAAPDATGGAQIAVFSGGVFTVTQIDDPQNPGGKITRLTLQGARPTGCPSLRGASGGARRLARAAGASKPGAHLWGDGKGRFQTKGDVSAATVRGTRWFVQERCAGTYTKVVRGVVAVDDFGRHRTVNVRAGDAYLARR
jgi:hypothetical protein